MRINELPFSRLILFSAAVLALSSISISQSRWEYRSDAEEKFEAALEKFSRGEFFDAAADFEYLINLPRHQRTTAAYIMLGKSFFQAKQFRESVNVLKKFIDNHLESTYIDDAYYTLGLNYEAQRRYEDAMVQFLAALEITDDIKIRMRATSFCENLADKNLSITMLTEILRDTHNPDSRDFLSVTIAEKYLAAGNIIMGERMLEPIVSHTPSSPYSSRAQTLLEKIQMGVSVKIGVLLPLMNKAAQKHLRVYGEDFLLGMKFALEDQHSEQTSLINIALDVRDTERDPPTAVKHTEELADDESVVIVVGPIFNNETIACADIANENKVPLITPTANADGIAAAGPYVFQANPDISSRGKAAARYAASVLELRTLAVVAPNDGNGKTMATAFIEEARSQGMRVLAAESYAAGATDLREQLIRLRRTSLIETEPLISFAEKISQSDIMHLAEAGVNPRRIDSLMDRSATVSVYKLLGPNGKLIADSIGLRTFVQKIKVDSLELPADGIQGIYMPINSPEEIAILTSQIAYYNIQAQLLGSGEWYNSVELDANKRYAEGVIFFSDFFADGTDPRYARFAKRWIEMTKRKISTNGILGYDVMSLVLSAMYQGATTRELLQQTLSASDRFPTLHAKITLKRNRVNSEFHVLQFKDADVKKLANLSID